MLLKTLDTNFVRSLLHYWKLNSPAFHPLGELTSRSYGKEVNKGKIVVVGLPKSGNVWLMNLLGDYFKIPTGLFSTKGLGVTVTHAPYNPHIYMNYKIKKTVYIMRDIRDIIVSYYYYSQTEAYKLKMDPSCQYLNIEDFYFDYFLTKVVNSYDWYKHAETYISHGSPLVKYENIWDNPQVEIKNILIRWGLEPDEKQINYCIEKNEIKSLSKTGKDSGMNIPSTHFRKGGYGGYINVLPKKVLNDIQTRFHDYLLRWGYDII